MSSQLLKHDPPPVPPEVRALQPAAVAASTLALGIIAGDILAVGAGWWILLALAALSVSLALPSIAPALPWIAQAISSIALIGQAAPPAVPSRAVIRPSFASSSDRGIGLFWAALLLVFVTGAAAQKLNHSPAAADFARVVARLDRHERMPLTVSGRITSFVARDSSTVRFNLSIESIHGRNTVMRVDGMARATIRKGRAHQIPPAAEACSRLRRGMQVRLHGTASRPTRNRNPADFNYREYLRRKGVSTLIFVSGFEDCRLLFDRADPVTRVRSWFKAAIRKSVPRSSRALPTALITGDRSGLERETRREFAESGLMHLLAISGLHVLFVGLAAYGLIKSMLTRFRFSWRLVETASTVMTLVLLSVYALMTGATPSVIRASIMAAVFLSGRPLFRTSNATNSLGVAAMIILLINPDSLFTAGFQLSFCAVFGLVTAGSTVSKWVVSRFQGRATRWCLGLLGASAVATLATAPVMMQQFGYIPLAGLLLNLAAIPLASVLLVASILATLLTPLWPVPAATIGNAAALLSLLLETLAEIGGTSMSWSLFRPPGHLPYLGIPVALTLSIYPHIRPRTRIRWLLVALALPALHLLSDAARGGFRPSVTVTFFDVGHGDAALIELPSNRTFLIDAGNRSRTWDYGERVILPHLRRERFPRVDAVVVSHPHSDHFGGLPSILRDYPVGCVYDNGKLTGTLLYREYLQLVNLEVGCLEKVGDGSVVELDAQVRVEVLAPPPGYDHEGENDESVVVKLLFGRTSFLFTGDVELDAEAILTRARCKDLKTDVIKVPHHGSRTSSTPALVRCSDPTWAVISVGRPDKYGLPDQEVVDRWHDAGSIVLTTLEYGAIQFRSDGHVITRIQ